MAESHIVLASTAGTAASKLFGVVLTVAIFLAALGIIFLVAGRVRGRAERPLTIVICLAPAVILALAGLVVPAIRTVFLSFTNTQATGQKFKLVHGQVVPIKIQNVGLHNYKIAFTDPDTRSTLIRTLLWIIIVPLVSVAVGLIIALMTDRMARPNLAKTLIFLPTAISFVGASLIWQQVYNAPVTNQNGSNGTQTGLLSKLAISFGWNHPPNWLLDSPLNTYLLMVILIWIQAGFAMVVLGAALKAIPDDVIEAARIDGASGATLFRTVQIPMIRSTLVVVLTTITIASLKVFDIVFTITGGNYSTDVLASRIYTDLFVTNVVGQGSALAVILFVCVIPLVAYNVVQIRRERSTPMTTSNPPIGGIAVEDSDPTLAQVTDAPKGKGTRRASRKVLSSPIATITVLIIVVIWTVPVFGFFVNSFRTKGAVGSSGWWNFFLHPGQTTFDNYHQVLTGDGGLTLPLVNSLAITIPATVIPIFLASMAGYVLAWVRFRGSDFIFFTLFALQVVPLQMALVPLQNYYNGGVQIGGTTIIPNFGLKGTLAQIWVSHTMFSLPIAVFLLHNFIAQLPSSIIEAARVDGASHLRIFRSVVLPLTTPAIASFTIFQFLWVWNDLLVAKTFGGSDPSDQPVTARVQSLAGSFGSHQELLAPADFLSIIIPLIVFLSLQRFFVRGLLAGSVKG